MGTLKQKLVAKQIKECIETGVPKTAGEILKNTDYSDSSSKQPKRILETAGVKEELKNIGINVEETDNVVRSILLSAERDQDKLKASDLIYKRLGSYKNESKMAEAAFSLSQMFDLTDDEDEDNENSIQETEEVPGFICEDDVESDSSTD